MTTKELMRQFESDPSSVPQLERVALEKYKAAVETVEKMSKDLDQLQSQIKQAMQRAQSMELALIEHRSKAIGILETLELFVDGAPLPVSKKETKTLEAVS